MRKANAILFLLLISSAVLRADNDYRSKLGVDIGGFKANAKTGVGWLAGLRYAHYLGTSNAYIGLNGYFGTPMGGSPSVENLWYGGGTVGYEGRMSKYFIWEGGLLLGVGAGKFMSTGQTSYYVAEPYAGIGFSLGNGIKLTIGGGYIHMTNANGYSGTSFGVRIDYKTKTAIREINE